jgi:hypothetical protein
MSLIRQRTKNLIAAGFIGFFVAISLLSLLSIFILRGNASVIEWILADNSLQVIKALPKEEEVPKIGVYLLTEAVSKDQVITQRMLKRVDLLETIVPPNAVVDMNQVLNKKATMDLEVNTLLSHQFIREPELVEANLELVEITDIRIPQLVAVGDSINLRIHFPTGQDYVVLRNKKVEFLDGEQKAFYISMNEEEILAYSSAREDILLYPGTLFYLSKEIQEIIHSVTQGTQEISPLVTTYSKYPLNPNALQLSSKFSDAFVMQHRKDLDTSLTQFYAQEGSRFTYVINDSLVIPLTVEEGDQSQKSMEPEKSITGDGNTVSENGTRSDTNNGTRSDTNNGTSGDSKDEASNETNNQTPEQPTNVDFGF